MSHNHPYRRLLADSDLRPDRRPDPGPYSSSDRPRASQDRDFYRQPQESFSSSSSSRGAKWSQDGALSILSSCGLEPSDLALLAKLPEDVLTVESLPEVLHQIKGKRGTIKPFPPSAPPPSSFSSSSSSSSYPHSSTRGSTVSPSTTDWDHGHSKPLKSLMDQVIPSPLPSDLDRWGNPRTSTSVRADSASSSSTSGYMVDFHHRSAQPECSRAGRDAGPVLSQDFHHRPGPSEFGKMGRDTGPASSQDFHLRPRLSEYGKTGRDAGRVSSHDFHHQAGSLKYGKTGRDANLASSQERAYFRSSGEGRRTRPSHLSQPGPADYRSAPPPAEVHLRTHLGRREPETSSTTSSSQPTMAMPSEREAVDFHGTCPPLFPYSCSLCDITVMSERVWIKHINGTQHADGQLSLLQQFPNWDCRMETVSRANNQSEKPKDEGGPGQQPQTARQSSTASQPSKKPQQKTSEEGKVVCVKFPAQSVDETYLRKLVEPFGKIVKILMFPSLAFVELGSVDQAKDLVKFHVNYPPTVNGEQMEFRISKTFSFLQSSRVVSFTPAPTGDSSQSDLISIIKRFGSPLYILFLPSMAFVEMKNSPDAQKLVDYYSSNTLRINGEILKVSFSGEYKSLMRVASAKRFEEETTKRKRSSSREKDDKSTEEKRKKSSKEEEKEGNRSSREKTRTRSRSREKSSRDRRTKSRSKSREKSKEKSRRSRSRSRDRFGRDRRTRTRSESREKSSRVRKSRSRSRSKGKSGAPEKREPKASESRSDPDPVRDSKPEAEEREQSAEEAESSAEESDIEGMEVIGEDGENLEDDVEESLDDADVEEENVEEEEQQQEEEEEAQEKDSCSAKRTDSSKEDAEEVKEGEPEETKVKEKPVNEKKEEKKEEDEKCGTKSQEEESERTTDPQLEDEEVETRLTQEEPDFPVDLENCITLDELEEEEEEGDEEVQREPESPSTRVISFRNLPLRSYTDAQFIRLVKDFGTAVRYFHKPPSCGFIEMSTSSEALRAVKELRRKPVIFNGSKLVIQMSNKYRRLTDGWEVQFDEDSDKEKRSQSSRRSARKNKDESDSKAEGKMELSKKTPEEESKSKSANKISSQKESVSRNTLESVEKESENESKSEKTSDKDEDSEESESRRTSGKESCETLEKNCRKTAEEESTSEQTEAENMSPANKLSENKSLPRSSREKETHEKHSVSEEKKELVNDEGQRKQELVATEAPEGEKLKEKGSEEDTCGPGLKDSESPDQPDSAPKPQTEQKPADDDSLRDSSRSGPAEGATELQKHTKPVGTEFVRPVVGYFCNLCQLIYADEDEAKLQHCSSLTHYRKYQEKTGKDPWAS